MKTLVLLTSRFPFGSGESFIGREVDLLSPFFEKIIIISQNVSIEKQRSIPENVTLYRYNPSTTVAGFLYLPILLFLNASVITEMLKGEIDFRLGKGDPFTLKKFIYLFKRVIKSVQLKEYVSKKLNQEGIKESMVLYSYWLKTGAHAIAMLKYKNTIRIARGHGSDIYEEKTEKGYLPLLKYSADNLDAIFFISKHGKQYFEEKTGMQSPRFFVSYLGVDKPDIEYIDRVRSENFVIVSCSNMVALKRIELIIDSLVLVRSEKIIQWLHFGDGILMNELTSYAEKRLGSLKKINYRFMGHYPNEDLMKYYSGNRVDLFINTSSSEGVPVSIMEAQCFGIPVIATDTGGVSELVTGGTGSLLPIDFAAGDLAKLIGHYLNLPENEENKLRLNAFNNWKSNFNASTNYTGFIMQLNSIFALSTEQRQF